MAQRKKLPSSDPQHYLFTHWPTFQFQQKDYDKRSSSIGNIVGQGRFVLISLRGSGQNPCVTTLIKRWKEINPDSRDAILIDKK